MAELRLDAVTRRWIVTGKRPLMPDVQEGEALCPFCLGNEHLTPKSIREFPGPSGAWAVRAFHDRAPMFRIEVGIDRRAEGMFDHMNTLGAHEVVVETPQHGLFLAQLPTDQIVRVIQVWRDRILDLKGDRRFRYISLFKDQNPPTPTFEGHSYSQVVATPVLPYMIETEFRVCRIHYQKKDRCLYCDIIQQEIRQDKRVVDQNTDFIALCPFASRSPYELWILPSEHSSSFEKDLSESPNKIDSLASLLKTSLQRVESISPSLHLVVHTEPNLNAHKPSKDWWETIGDDFHWHIEIDPEIEGEHRYLGSEGFYFNPIPAEEAALVLRALSPEADPAARSSADS